MEIDIRVRPQELEFLAGLASGKWTDIRLPNLSSRLGALKGHTTFAGTGLFVEAAESIYVGVVGHEVNKTTFCRLALASRATAPRVFSELAHTGGIGSLVRTEGMAHLGLRGLLGCPLTVLLFSERREETLVIGNEERDVSVCVNAGLLVSSAETSLLIHLDQMFNVTISTDAQYITQKIRAFSGGQLVVP